MTPNQNRSAQPRPAPQGEALRWTGATLIFIAEVLTFLALAWWGFSFHGPIQWLIGLGLPIAAAVLWGLALAPRARFTWPAIPRVAARTALLLAGGAALIDVGAVFLGWLEITFVIAGTILTWGWEPPRPPRPVPNASVTPASATKEPPVESQGDVTPGA